MTQKKIKPWSTKKRVASAVLLSLLILLIAILIGTTIYLTGRWLGLFGSPSIEQAVMREVRSDQQLTNAFYRELDTRICSNELMGFKVTYERPLFTMESNEDVKCTEFALIGAQGKPALIKVTHEEQSRKELMEAYVASMTEASSEPFSHPKYEAASIMGIQEGMAVQIVVIETSELDSWSLVYYPADAAGKTAFEKLAKSFSLIDYKITQ